VGATVAIADSQYAVTGTTVAGVPSQGAILLHDNSAIVLGANTRVQMKSFEQAGDLTTANFVVEGKIRFRVDHPKGAKANYTFATSTGQIAVRGTQGDIWDPQPGSLQVNVYQVSDPSLPVEVTLNNGAVYHLGAGQTLTVGLAGAVVAAGSAASVSSTSQTSMDNFKEFGNTAETAAGIAAAASAAAAAAGGGAGFPLAAVAGGLVAAGGVIIGTTSGGGSGGSSPSPSTIGTTPSTLTFTPGTGPQTFQASEAGFSGPFSASIDQPSVATVNAKSSDGVFTVTPKSNGSATITVSGGSASSGQVSVAVQATTIVVPGSLPTFSTVGQTQNFTASEIYYGGQFTAKSDDTAVAKVTSPSSSSSSGGSFTVTSTGGGSTQIVVADSLGHTAPVSVKVAPAPTPTQIPICIGMVRGNGRDWSHRMDPMMVSAPSAPHPMASPTCPPTPMAGPPVVHTLNPPVTRAPQPHPVGPQPPVIGPPNLPGMPTPPPMPGGPP
jgi:hypothetical protein